MTKSASLKSLSDELLYGASDENPSSFIDAFVGLSESCEHILNEKLLLLVKIYRHDYFSTYANLGCITR